MNTNSEEFTFHFFWNDEFPLSYDRLVGLLKVFGDLLPDPLSHRIVLEDYATKLLNRADVGCAFHNNEIVGIIAMYANDNTEKRAHIPFISVLPIYQGHGIGKTMISRSIALSRQKGMRSLWLTVDYSNKVAQHVYSSLGFSKTSASSQKIVMELDLIANFDILEPKTTNVDPAPRLAAALGLDIDLRVKRDDLYPLIGGGIKARKIIYIVREAIQKGYTALVTNGGPQSNHARATAVLAAMLGLKCHLVIVLEPETNYSITGNILLMRMSGASIEYCTKNQLSARMDNAVSALANKGHKPLYIWGGGHCLQGTVAFVEAANEARRQCGTWIPDYVILASATGSTQAGIAIGYADLHTIVIGVSVARGKERGSGIVQECIDEYLAVNGIKHEPIKVNFRDDWTDGGYEVYSQELFSVLSDAAKTGYFFDPTYSGKALRGLVSMFYQGEIPSRSKVLLWHTGGLMNLQAVQKLTEGALKL